MTPASAAEKRRQQNRADARRTILDAAELLLPEVGHDGFSIRRLVARCGYSAPTIYHYFGDKAGLIEALLEERLLAELIETQQAVPCYEDPLDEARSRFRAFVRWGVDRPNQYRLLTLPRDEDAPPLPSSEQALALLQSPYQRLVEVGRLPEQDVEALGQAVWACLHGLIALPAIRPDVQWAPELVERSIDALLSGWLANPMSSNAQADSHPSLRAVEPAQSPTPIQRAHSQEKK
ncbi:MAG: TetR/AcrR family transcriptional regulator [Myxococcota bacterium]|nr:TetR/AcrR family transcriptional regulator [Myxococcota bacterium]